MIELTSDRLIFSFPSVSSHLSERVRSWVDNRISRATDQEKANLNPKGEELYRLFERSVPKVSAAISFQRTLRIPDDGKEHLLPPGLGQFPVRHVDDFSSAPESWKKRGGVMMPLHKTEALWLHFQSAYPMAVKVGAGGICAISGEKWPSTLNSKPQSYAVLPLQPWIDGFRVSEGVIRQFVAVPLGKGLTVENQLTGEETWGGLQLQAFPMSADRYWSAHLVEALEEKWDALTDRGLGVMYSMSSLPLARRVECSKSSCEAGLGAGGRMRQEITRDPFGIAVWDITQTSRCFAHLCLSDEWEKITGTQPPPPPRSASDYTQSGGTWFDYVGEGPAVLGETVLSDIKSVGDIVKDKTGLDLPDNASVKLNHQIAKIYSRTVREF